MKLVFSLVLFACCTLCVSFTQSIRLSDYVLHPYQMDTAKVWDKYTYRFYDIRFNFAKATLLEESKPALDTLAAWLRKKDRVQVEIGVYSDSRLSDMSSTKLTLSRARTVCAYLVNAGVETERLLPEGFEGADVILDDNFIATLNSQEQELAHAVNRRVEIRIRNLQYETSEIEFWTERVQNHCPEFANKLEVYRVQPVFFQSRNVYILYVGYQTDNNLYAGVCILDCENGETRKVWSKAYINEEADHTFSLVDLNSDKKPDILRLSGYDNEFYSELLMSSDSGLFYAASSSRDYWAVVDLNQDGIPEILDGNSANPHTAEFVNWQYSDSLRAKIQQKYTQVNTVPGARNYTYNMPDYEAIFNTWPGQKVRIRGWVDGGLQDVTSQYPEYIRWRLEVENELMKQNLVYKAISKEVIRYWKELLK